MEAGAGTARKSDENARDYEVGKPRERAGPSRLTSRGAGGGPEPLARPLGHWVMAAEEESPSRYTWA